VNIAGHYIRTGQGGSAELRITSSLTVSYRYHIEGLALYGEERLGGPNMGVLEFSSDLEGTTIRHSENGEEGHQIVLIFSADSLEVTEENWVGVYGMNVNFVGTYQRASALGGMLSSIRRAVRRLLSRMK